MTKAFFAGLAACVLATTLAGCGATADAETSTSTSDTTTTTSTSTTTGKNTGKAVSVNYIGTLEDGTEFDNSYTNGSTLDFTVGDGTLISGFDAAVANMEVGETKTVTLSPDEAYGDYDESLVITYSKDDVSTFDELSVGDTVYLTTTSGSTVSALVTDKTEDTITVDANSQLAGKTLIFQIELVSVED
jgi:FKBP-type peptidyl-prolyl cis-trans isomerase 2